MIKRNIIQRVILHYTKDGSGGRTFEKEYKEKIDANVSLKVTYADMNQFNLKEEKVIHVVTNQKLDETKETRYEFNGVLYQVRWQVQQGIEFFSTLVETPN